MRQVHCSRTLAVAILMAGLAVGACKHPTPVAVNNPVPTTTAPPTPTPPPNEPCPTPSVTLTATSTVTRGQAATLTWQAFNADSLRIDNEIGTVPVNGNRQVTPQNSVTYTATATSKCGQSSGVARITVTEQVVLNPPAPPIIVPPTPPAAPVGGGRPPETGRPPQPTPEPARLLNILFDYDKAELRQDQMMQLQQDANYLKQNPTTRVIVEGHADERGNQEYNLALGVRRANAVVEYLVSQGVTESRIRSISYGKERPLCLEASPDEGCHQKNRRAAFTEAR